MDSWDYASPSSTTSTTPGSERSDPPDAPRRGPRCDILLYGSKYYWCSPSNMLAIQEQHSKSKVLEHSALGFYWHQFLYLPWTECCESLERIHRTNEGKASVSDCGIVLAMAKA